jgi:hypothetical protein
MNFENILKEFDTVLKQYNLTSYSKLQPPLSNEDRGAIFNSLEIIDNDIQSLYKWKNGVVDDTSAPILSFECSMLSLESLIGYNKEGYLINEINTPGLLMLFDNQEDGFLFNTNAGEDYGRIHLYCVSLLSIQNPRPYFDSLSSMLLTTIEQYQRKGLLFDETNNILSRDIDISVEVYNKYNPISNHYGREGW